MIEGTLYIYRWMATAEKRGINRTDTALIAFTNISFLFFKEILSFLNY
jgi:hypothetical protein